MERGKCVDKENKELHVKIKQKQELLDNPKDLEKADKEVQTKNIGKSKEQCEHL